MKYVGEAVADLSQDSSTAPAIGICAWNTLNDKNALSYVDGNVSSQPIRSKNTPLPIFI